MTGIEHRLMYGTGLRRYATVKPHSRHRDLWVWFLPDGRVARDPLSLPRAKAEAEAIMCRMPQLDPAKFRWVEVP